MKKNNGFTLIEILVAIVIISLVSLILLAGFKAFYRQRSLDGAAVQIHAMLNKARQQTLTSKNTAAYGVRFNTQAVYLYQGSFSSSSPAPIQTLIIDRVVKLSPISLTGGTNDVRFTKLTGESSATGTIAVTLVENASSTRTFTIYQSGLVDIQ